ncbi:MAG: hypothetical protein JW986_06645 [Methanotrichaceae archaeon]|nr:hypothetical protein [Methanotrichaceae archaeon]
MDEDDIIKRMTGLLERGGTMLASTHQCGATLFRYNGRLICPVCSFDESGKLIEEGEAVSGGRPASISKGSREVLSGGQTGRGMGRFADEGLLKDGLVEGGFAEDVSTEEGRAKVEEGAMGAAERPGMEHVIGEGGGKPDDEFGAVSRTWADRKAEGESVADKLPREAGLEEASIRMALLWKLEELAEGMRSEGDLDKLRRQLECIEVGVRVLRSLEDRPQSRS